MKRKEHHRKKLLAMLRQRAGTRASKCSASPFKKVCEELLESKNVKTVVCVSGPEVYETLRDGMRDAFEQVNRLAEKKTLDVGNLTVPVTFFSASLFSA